MERINFNRIEQFAVAKAKEQLVAAQSIFQALVDDIADAHGLPAGERAGWNLTPGGDALVKAVPDEKK